MNEASELLFVPRPLRIEYPGAVYHVTLPGGTTARQSLPTIEIGPPISKSWGSTVGKRRCTCFAIVSYPTMSISC